MKFIYPAVFTPGSDGGFHAVFPDLEGCEAFGETLEEAIERANEAAFNWISVELDEESPMLPGVSELSDLQLSSGEEARYISVNIRFYEGWDE